MTIYILIYIYMTFCSTIGIYYSSEHKEKPIAFGAGLAIGLVWPISIPSRVIMVLFRS